jgi:glycerophosphoryl diester phosphodiesterase
VNIDLKESTAVRERRLWELIRKMGVEERVLVASGDLHEPILRFRHFSGRRVATSASAKEVRSFVLAHFARATGLLRPAYDALQVPELHRGVRVVSPSAIAAAHRLGLEVHVWTVDERETMERLLSWGVDGIMSDQPDVLAQVMDTVKGNA